MLTVPSRLTGVWLALLAVEGALVAKFTPFLSLTSARALTAIARNTGLSSTGLGSRRIILAFLVGTVVFSGRQFLIPRPSGLERRFAWNGVLHGIAFALFLLLMPKVALLAKAPFQGGVLFFLAWGALGALAAGIAVNRILPALNWAFHAMAWGAGFAALATGIGLLGRFCWDSLAWVTFAMVRLQLAPFFDAVAFDEPNLILRSSHFSLKILLDCSGYEGVGLWLAFIALYLWASREHLRLRRAMVVVPLGAIAIWIANSLRISAMFLIGKHLSVAVALQGFHDQSGWIIFIAISLAAVAAMERTAWFWRERPAGGALSEDDALLPALLMPLMVTIAAAMATGAFAVYSQLDWFYPFRVLATGAILFYFRARYATLLGHALSRRMALCGVAVAVLWLWLAPADSQGSRSGATFEQLPGAFAAAWLVFKLLGYTFTVPLAEELAFRGFLIPQLERVSWPEWLRPHSASLACVVSAALFALFHSGWLAGFVAGLIYCLAYKWRGRVTDAFVAHAATNGALALYVFCTGDWSAWS